MHPSQYSGFTSQVEDQYRIMIDCLMLQSLQFHFIICFATEGTRERNTASLGP